MISSAPTPSDEADKAEEDNKNTSVTKSITPGAGSFRNSCREESSGHKVSDVVLNLKSILYFSIISRSPCGIVSLRDGLIRN